MIRVQPNAGPEDTRGRVRILLATAPSMAPTAITRTVNETEQPNPDRPLNVVSFMDGYGTARYAIGDLCKQMGHAHNYRSSALVEVDERMARRVEAYWQTPEARRTDNGPPHNILSLDVWDLFNVNRDGRSTWIRYVDDLPRDSLLLMICSSPCQDMTRAGQNRGLTGLVGLRSVDFYGPAAAYIDAQERRPDLHVHLVCEMVHPTEEVHSTAMRTALGDLPADNAVIMNADTWVACPRIRSWLATFRPSRPEHLFSYPRLPSPWEPRWALLPDGATATCLRSRGDGDEILPSSYQTHLRFLVYDLDHNNRWFLCTQAEIKSRVLGILQRTNADQQWPGVRDGLNLVCSGRERESPGAEAAVRTWGRWLMSNGREHGLRAPTEQERARAVGMADYYHGLQLQGRELYDAVGNHFDPRCLQQRVSTLLRDWFNGIDPPRPPRAAYGHIRRSFNSSSEFARTRCPFAPRAAGPLRHDMALARNFGQGHPVQPRGQNRP